MGARALRNKLEEHCLFDFDPVHRGIPMPDVYRHRGVPIVIRRTETGYAADWTAVRCFVNAEGDVEIAAERADAVAAACGRIDAAILAIVHAL